MHNEGHGKPFARARPGATLQQISFHCSMIRRKPVARLLRDGHRFSPSLANANRWRGDHAQTKSIDEHAIAIRRIGEEKIVRRASESQRPWKIRSGNPPVHSFRRAEPRDGSESLPPICEPPWVSACGVFPNTRNPCRFRCGKSRHKMIDAGKGEALWIPTPAPMCDGAGIVSSAVSTLVRENPSSSRRD
jgi:hypothetical protein